MGCALSEGRVFPECRKPAAAQASSRGSLTRANNSTPARAVPKPMIPSLGEISETASKPNGQEELQSELDAYVNRWFYGPGLGQSTLNIGTVVLFPPYVLYLLGNAGLQLAGYEPVSVLSYVPGEPGDYVRASYDAITGVPGRTTSTIAGEDFQGEDPCIP